MIDDCIACPLILLPTRGCMKYLYHCCLRAKFWAFCILCFLTDMKIWVKWDDHGLNCFVGKKNNNNLFWKSRYKGILPAWPVFITKTLPCLVTPRWIREKSSALVHSYLLFKCVSIFLLKGIFAFLLVLPRGWAQHFIHFALCTILPIIFLLGNLQKKNNIAVFKH